MSEDRDLSESRSDPRPIPRSEAPMSYYSRGKNGRRQSIQFLDQPSSTTNFHTGGSVREVRAIPSRMLIRFRTSSDRRAILGPYKVILVFKRGSLQRGWPDVYKVRPLVAERYPRCPTCTPLPHQRRRSLSPPTSQALQRGRKNHPEILWTRCGGTGNAKFGPGVLC